MVTENLDIAADRVQIHGCARGRTPTGRNSTARTGKTVSGPGNLVSHHESLSGSSGLASQQGGNHPRYGMC